MIDFYAIFHEISGYLQANIKISIALALLLLFLIFKKPKVFFLILFISLLLSGLIYLISNVATTGTSFKSQMIKRSTLPP